MEAVVEKFCKDCEFIAPMAVKVGSGETPYFICIKYLPSPDSEGKIECDGVTKVDCFDTCDGWSKRD